MNRSLVIVLGALALGAAVFAGSYFASQRMCATRATRPADDLAWLRTEFQLGDAELVRIRTLHAGYLPKCAEMCDKIAAKKIELEAALAGATYVSAAAQQKLNELAGLRATCQGRMLQHFAEVSREMPPEQGRRYLAEMQRLTLGFHEATEQSMSGSRDHALGPQ